MVRLPMHSSARPSLTRLGFGRHALRRGIRPHQPVKHSVYIHGQVLERRRRGPRIGPHYQKATRRKHLAAIGEDMPESPFDPIARHRVSDRPAHDEAHPWRLGTVRAGQQVGDDKRSSGAAAAPDDFGELGAPPHPVYGRQHGEIALAVRPRGARGPYAAERREWRGPRGCACAAGNRGSSRGDGCSAGTYACSLVGSGAGRARRGGPLMGNLRRSAGMRLLRRRSTLVRYGPAPSRSNRAPGRHFSTPTPRRRAVINRLWTTV